MGVILELGQQVSLPIEYISKHNPQYMNHSLVECRLVEYEISRAGEYKCPRALQCLLHTFLNVTRVKLIKYFFDFRSGSLEDLGLIRVLILVFGTVALEFVSELGLNLEFSVVDAVQGNLRRPRGGAIPWPVACMRAMLAQESDNRYPTLAITCMDV